jgi:hypothetical protein
LLTAGTAGSSRTVNSSPQCLYSRFQAIVKAMREREN